MPLPHELYGSVLLRAVKTAVDDACADLRATGRDDGQISRLMMAVRLTTAVAEGELDPAKLKLVALDAVGFRNERGAAKGAPDAAEAATRSLPSQCRPRQRATSLRCATRRVP